MLEFTRRRILSALSGSSMTTLAGCESIPVSTEEKSSPSEPDKAVSQSTEISSDDPYDVTIKNVVASAHEAYFLISIRRRSSETVYTSLSPVHIRTRQDITIHRLIPDMEKQELKQAGVDLTLGVATELFPVPGPGLIVDVIEIYQDVVDEHKTAPNHATLAPTVKGKPIRYLVWIKSEKAVEDWAQPKTNIWYEFATSSDKTIRRRELSPLRWPSCGEMPSLTPSTPSETPTNSTIVDGFEDGNISEYSGQTGGFQVQQSVVKNGDWALEGQVQSGENQEIYRSVTVSQPSRVQGYVRVGKGGGNENAQLFYHANGPDGPRPIHVDFSLNHGNSGFGDTSGEPKLLVNGEEIIDVEYNEWYFVELREVNWNNESVGKVVVDGSLMAENVAFEESASSIDTLRIRVNDWGNETAWFDDVTI